MVEIKFLQLLKWKNCLANLCCCCLITFFGNFEAKCAQNGSKMANPFTAIQDLNLASICVKMTTPCNGQGDKDVRGPWGK
jgi:hypothetical protein